MAAKKAAPKVAAQPGKAAPYSVTKWAGKFDNYQCSLCGFAHLDKAVLIGHVKAHHTTLADAPSAAHSQ